MLPLVLRDALASGEVLRADGTRTALHSNVSGEEARRLYDVVRARDPEATIEIGLAQGISALAIAQALHDNGSGALHHVVDPFQASRWDDIGLANLDRAGLGGQVEFHGAFPEEVIPRLPTVDFAFVDASHLFDLSILDFVLVDKRLRAGGLIGFHDLWMGSLQKVLRYILTNRSYRIHDDRAPTAGSTRSRSPDSAGKDSGWKDSGWKDRVSTVVRRVPCAQRVLRPEMLMRTERLGLRPRMVFVEKTDDDRRSWDFHRDF